MSKFRRATALASRPANPSHTREISGYLAKRLKGVPIIDFGKLVYNQEEQSFLAQTISKSGFFYLKNFGIDEAVFKNLINNTADFFNQPEEMKSKMICDELPIRGFTPLKAENLSKRLELGNYPDLCMKYSWSLKDNIFPNEDFKGVWQKYYGQIGEVAAKLLTVISKIISNENNLNEEDWELIIKGDNCLRHLYYPDLLDIQELSMAPHSDLGSVSILYQTPCPNGHIALEAEIGGKFVKIPSIRGTLVVNLGYVLSHITEGKVKATEHRIVHTPKPGGERTSTICFYLPQRDFNLKKFSGSDFGGAYNDNISTFGELIDSNGIAYLNKKDRQ